MIEDMKVHKKRRKQNQQRKLLENKKSNKKLASRLKDTIMLARAKTGKQ